MSNIIDLAADKFVFISIVGCLIIGYILKTSFTKFPNNKIPAVLALVGAVIACISQKSINLDAIIYGALSGLSSTGLHQAFTRFIEGTTDSVEYVDVSVKDIEDLKDEDVEHIELEETTDVSKFEPKENAEG